MKQMNRRDFVRAGVGLSLAAGTGLVQSSLYAAAKRSNRPNVLWIMMDDGRADAVGCYGKAWARTPNMDRLATGGVRFAYAIVQNPVCVPSRKSMKSGHYCHFLGVMAMGKPPAVPGEYMKRARPDVPNLLNAWKQAGINPVNVGKTHAYQKDWVNKGDPPALIDVFGNPQGAEGKAKFDAAEGFKYQPVNIKTHQWMIGICRGTYYGMVSLVDVQVGRLVQALEKAGLLDNTIIVINSDQGFQLGEHGLWKKRVMYEQNVCVPFIRVMVRTKEWKLIYFMDERVADKDGALYNLKNDPGETTNHYGKPQYADVVARLENLANEWNQTT